MSNAMLPLVNWGMGTFMIVIFGLVCVILILVVYQMVKSGKK